MDKELRWRIGRLKQVAEALASHFVWETTEQEDIPDVEEATQVELLIKNKNGGVLWRSSMRVGDL
jgi:hypothetical protein